MMALLQHLFRFFEEIVIIIFANIALPDTTDTGNTRHIDLLYTLPGKRDLCVAAIGRSTACAMSPSADSGAAARITPRLAFSRRFRACTVSRLHAGKLLQPLPHHGERKLASKEDEYRRARRG